jgi:hypothetical protein
VNYKSSILIALLFSYLFFGQIIAAWPFTIDDSYISLTYAKNLVVHGSLTWNGAQLHVEGYSNFSYVMLAALAMKLGLDALIALKAFSVVMLLVTLVFLYRLTRLWLTREFAFIPSLWLLCYKGQILWTVSGLETSAFQCFLLLSVYTLIRGLGFNDVTHNFESLKSQKLNLIAFLLCGLFLSLAGLSRPESPALMLMLFITTLFFFNEFKANKKVFIQAIGLTTLVIVAIYLPYFLWRWHYYGRLFPHPVYCKWLVQISQGELDWNYIKLIWPLLLLSLPYLFRTKDKRTIILIAPSIVYLLLLYDADSIVGFLNRHFLAAFCLLLPLALFGLIRINQWVLSNAKYSKTSIYIGAMTVGLFLIPGFSLNNYHYFATTTANGNNLRMELVQWLNTHLEKNDALVIADCGLVPFMSKNEVIDAYCLNNPMMTQAPINNSYPKFVDWVLTEKKPKAIIINSWQKSAKLYIEPAANYFLSDSRFLSHYSLVNTIKLGNPDEEFRYQIYLRNSF